jgi:hypothetical protein
VEQKIQCRSLLCHLVEKCLPKFVTAMLRQRPGGFSQCEGSSKQKHLRVVEDCLNKKGCVWSVPSNLFRKIVCAKESLLIYMIFTLY